MITSESIVHRSPTARDRGRFARGTPLSRIAAMLACCVGSALASPSLVAAPAVAPHRSVLFIVVDDLNTSLGCYGNAQVKTPQIDRLAARGVRFDRAYCQYPLCNPSRVSMLTGRRPETTGVYVLSKSARAAVPDGVMLPQFFRQQGYATVGIGKVYHSEKMNDPASWDRYENGDGNNAQERAAIRSRYGGGDGRPSWTELDGDGADTRDGIVASTIGTLIREHGSHGRSFFLAAGFHKPHLPWTAPRRFFDLYRPDALAPDSEPEVRGIPAIALQTELSGFEQPESRAAAMRGYYACVSFTDSLVGKLLDELDRLDLWRSTIVVLVGDNGFHLGDHGGLWAKLSAFDAATRVPLIVAGAGVPAGRTVVDPVELVDIYPTLVELTGFRAPVGLEGRSLVRCWSDAKAAGPAVAFSIVYHYDVAQHRDVLGRTVVGRDWRYTEWGGGTVREFYRRASDPGEYVNRIDEAATSVDANAARQILATRPEPKPGPANRPRALAPPGDRVN